MEQHTPAAGGGNLFNNVDHYFDDNINNLRPNQLPEALKGICGKDNSGQLGSYLAIRLERSASFASLIRLYVN